jgi:magnesium-transporting ATPase (P-type)
MRSTSFVLAFSVIIILAVWLLLRMVINTDPDVPTNVAVVLLLAFTIAASVITLASWWLIRRFRGEERRAMAMRHGVWGGLLLVALPLLRWMEALSVLVIIAVLLVVFGLESLILLQPEPQERAEEQADEPSVTPSKG